MQVALHPEAESSRTSDYQEGFRRKPERIEVLPPQQREAKMDVDPSTVDPLRPSKLGRPKCVGVSGITLYSVDAYPKRPSIFALNFFFFVPFFGNNGQQGFRQLFRRPDAKHLNY